MLWEDKSHRERPTVWETDSWPQLMAESFATYVHDIAA